MKGREAYGMGRIWHAQMTYPPANTTVPTTYQCMAVLQVSYLPPWSLHFMCNCITQLETVLYFPSVMVLKHAIIW